MDNCIVIALMTSAHKYFSVFQDALCKRERERERERKKNVVPSRVTMKTRNLEDAFFTIDALRVFNSIVCIPLRRVSALSSMSCT